MMTPTITLHGTSKADLIRGYTIALRALDEATEMVSLNAAPNSRDYPGDFALALDEHRDRCQRLISVSTEIAVILDAILKQ